MPPPLDVKMRHNHPQTEALPTRHMGAESPQVGVRNGRNLVAAMGP